MKERFRLKQSALTLAGLLVTGTLIAACTMPGATRAARASQGPAAATAARSSGAPAPGTAPLATAAATGEPSVAGNRSARDTAGAGSNAGSNADANANKNDATTQRETHGDWQVLCGKAARAGDTTAGEAATQCTVSQEQVDSKSHRPVFGVQLAPPATDGVHGVLVLPFGLALERGVTLKLDRLASAQNLPYKTCVPAGCLVALAFKPAFVAALRKGAQLTVGAVAAAGQPVNFTVPMKGFGTALDRSSLLSH
jgi:invasion protein IalB